MSLDLTERELLAETVSRMIATRAPISTLDAVVGLPEGYDHATWTQLAELGAAALLVAEERGGMEQSMAEVVAVAMELGRALVPGPFLGTAVHAAALLEGVDDGDRRLALLESIAAGETVVAVVDAHTTHAEPDDEGGWILDGAAEFVLDGAHADLLIVAASGVVVAIDPSDAAITPVPMADETRRLAAVSFNRVRVGAADVLATGARADAAREAARGCFELAIAADCVGGADTVLHLAVEYAKTRHQFGRAIGSFQAIKHKLADMYVQVEAARAIVVEVGDEAARTSGPAPSSSMAVAAVIAATEAYISVAGDAIQVHGGIGFTWEHICHRYFKRAWLNRALVGGPGELRRRFGAAVSGAHPTVTPPGLRGE